MEQMALMNQGKLDALTGDYTISVATGSLTVLTLVPKDAVVRAILSSLEVHMLPGLFRDARSRDERAERRLHAHHVSQRTARREISSPAPSTRPNRWTSPPCRRPWTMRRNFFSLLLVWLLAAGCAARRRASIPRRPRACSPPTGF